MGPLPVFTTVGHGACTAHPVGGDGATEGPWKGR